MLRGDFATAWTVSDGVLRERLRSGECCDDWPRHLKYVWRGESLRGRHVLVRCYHGLGDTIQFVRLLEPLREQAAHAILWVQPGLVELLASVKGVDELIPLHQGTPECAYDVDIEIMELAHYLRITRDTIPRRIPYIYESLPRPNRSRVGALNVGIAWKSGDWDPARSIPDEIAARLGTVRGIRWHSLQYAESSAPVPARQLVDKDIGLTARRMLALDLVISVDTLTAHLAGALGLRVWTLLPYDCDWRWMRSGTRSPWYPTMRLFRQPVAGDWAAVIDEVCGALGQADVATRARGTRSAGCTTSSS